MPAPSVLLSGYTTAMYAQPGAAPTPLTVANLSSQAAVAALAIAANRINIEDVPNFGGSSSALKNFASAGNREGDQIPVQVTPQTYAITIPWNPSDAITLLLRNDFASGLIDRTYIFASTADSANFEYYAFNARVSGFEIASGVGSEAQAIVTIARRGNQYGWSATP